MFPQSYRKQIYGTYFPPFAPRFPLPISLLKDCTRPYVPELRSWYSDLQQLRLSGDRMPVHPGPEAHPTSIKLITRLFPQYKAAGGMAMTIHPHPAPRLREE
jgi:hypothetical protein